MKAALVYQKLPKCPKKMSTNSKVCPSSKSSIPITYGCALMPSTGCARTAKSKTWKLSLTKRLLLTVGLTYQPVLHKKHSGINVIQLETASGAAIKNFQNAIGINVPRSRFLPVKKTSDLMLVMSNLYDLKSGSLLMSEKRQFKTTPLIKLGDEHFKKVFLYSVFSNVSHVFLIVFQMKRLPTHFWYGESKPKVFRCVGGHFIKNLTNIWKQTVLCRIGKLVFFCIFLFWNIIVTGFCFSIFWCNFYCYQYT